MVAGGANAPNRQPDLLAYAREHGVADRFRYVGRVGDEQLKALYQGCQAVLFPSLAEGWGLPVAEAAALGARVLASRNVPAAAPLGLELAPDAWASAMADGEKGRMHAHGVSSMDAGRKLMEVLVCAMDRPMPTATASGVLRERQPASGEADGVSVAVCGDWRSPSGFGETARCLYGAMRYAGVSCQKVPVPKDQIQIPDLDDGGCRAVGGRPDVWVHCVPPDWINLGRDGKHVACFVWETDRLSPGHPLCAEWIKQLNRVDEVWVPARFISETLARSGVTTPVQTIPTPIDVDLYAPGARRAPPCSMPPGFDPTWTVFLYVGTWDDRKRPDVLVRAFCSAFGVRDRAVLILKSYVTGDVQRDTRVLQDWVNSARSGPAHVAVIPGVMATREMLALCQSATVFATASRGEGFCLPAIQAMSCGQPVIAAKWSAFRDYPVIQVDYETAYVPRKVRLPGYGPDQRWAVVDEDDLACKLAWAHSNRPAVAKLGQESRKWVLEHASIRAAGPRYHDRLLALAGKQAAENGG